MNVIKLVWNALKQTFFSFSAHRNIQEALISYDFKINTARQNLMRLCFSQMAEWPVYLILFIIWIDPTKFFWSVQSFYLLDGRLPNMIFFYFLFFGAGWILKNKTSLIALLFYFLGKSDLHVNLALAGFLACLLSNDLKFFLLKKNLHQPTRKIFSTFTGLQIFSSVVITVISIYILHFFQQNFYFSQPASSLRFLFLVVVLFASHFLKFSTQTLWGHFFLNRPVDPSEMPIHYSTLAWFTNTSLRPSFRKKLRGQVQFELKSHTEYLQQIQQMKDQGLGQPLRAIENTIQTELNFLRQAASRLTID